MIEYLSRFIRWAVQNKKYAALVILTSLFFLFVIFPFDDLSDRVTSEVSRQTQNQIYLQMDGLNLSFLTGLSLELDKVVLQTPTLSPIKINRLEISPSLFSLIEQFPLGSVLAEGLLRGSVEATLSSGSKGSSGQKRQIVALQAEKLNLEQLQQILKLPIPMKGQAQLNLKSLTDFSFVDQPDADFNLNLQKFEIPATTLRTGAGPIDIPDLKWDAAQLKGKLSGGILQIDSIKIGSPQNDLSAQISGQVKVRMQTQGQQVIPVIGGYDLSIEMKLKKPILSKIEFFLFPLDQYKRVDPEGNSYRFKMRADNIQSVPTFGSLQ